VGGPRPPAPLVNLVDQAASQGGEVAVAEVAVAAFEEDGDELFGDAEEEAADGGVSSGSETEGGDDVAPPPPAAAFSRPAKGITQLRTTARQMARLSAPALSVCSQAFSVSRTKGQGDGFCCRICHENKPWDVAYNASGSKQYPTWVDNACGAAAKRLQLSITAEEGKLALRALKKRPEEYSLRILELKDSQLRAGECQRAQCLKLMERIVVEFRLCEQTGYELMDKDSYVAFKMFKKAKTREEANDDYAVDLKDKDVYKTIHAGVTYIAVKLNMRLLAQKSVNKTRELEMPETVLRTDREKSSGIYC